MQHPQNLLIIGATSAIATATSRLYAERGARLFLLARDVEHAELIAADLMIRGATTVEVRRFDANNLDALQGLVDAAFDALERIDAVLIAHGTLPDQKSCEQDLRLTVQALNINAISTVAILTHVANRLERQGSGSIAAISSVAGDRGRQSNYVYGAAKGMVSIYLQGLRNRLSPLGIHVMTIKPGFVDTPMTSDFSKGILWAKPDAIARGIGAGFAKKKDIIYLPRFWRLIMLVIVHVPEVVFKRLRL